MQEDTALPEAEIVDSIPIDLSEAKKERKQRSDTGKKKTARKPRDKYAILQSKLEKAFAIPPVLMTFQAMQTNNEVMLADAELLGNHVESFAEKLVNVAREHEWFYSLLMKISALAVGGSAIGALIAEVIVIGIGLMKNHGATFNVPGFSKAA